MNYYWYHQWSKSGWDSLSAPPSKNWDILKQFQYSSSFWRKCLSSCFGVPLILFCLMCYHSSFMCFKRTWNSLSLPIPIGGALHQSKQILWYFAVMQSSAVVGYQKTDWTISLLSKPVCFTAPRLLGDQGKATKFISTSSCSHDTVFKKGFFSTQIIHPQLTESWLFHFGLLKLKWKHFVLASWAAAFCSRSLQCSFACGSGASQSLQKVRSSTPKYFADCTPQLLWDFSFHIFPDILWETKDQSGRFLPTWNEN